MIRKELKGLAFGRLKVIELIGSKNKQLFWRCRCKCGKFKDVASRHLVNNLIISCGCYKSQNAIKLKTKHGDNRAGKRTPEYRCWSHIKSRCYNPKVERYPHYGGRGITVCQRWLQSFENFLSDMGRRPSKHHSIDRIDNDGNYEPNNCRWATASEQQQNKHRSKPL